MSKFITRCDFSENFPLNIRWMKTYVFKWSIFFGIRLNYGTFNVTLSLSVGKGLLSCWFLQTDRAIATSPEEVLWNLVRNVKITFLTKIRSELLLSYISLNISHLIYSFPSDNPHFKTDDFENLLQRENQSKSRLDILFLGCLSV